MQGSVVGPWWTEAAGHITPPHTLASKPSKRHNYDLEGLEKQHCKKMVPKWEGRGKGNGNRSNKSEESSAVSVFLGSVWYLNLFRS